MSLIERTIMVVCISAMAVLFALEAREMIRVPLEIVSGTLTQ